ncbi:hypothetical protein AYL99_11942 [Fonsecaea erecta]|uniref:Tc1-like transposase DDE domain-containing protein n=1 Tax=Fonsecaea erecta TaxID=1367422 RepID=A0A178Z2C5_9EURO|nr:hypothetical protein AYL99_11942 [Fonsecaea erecta]OAP53920.1 hypothetical protein AYL99_11942 [Fonsecaea erecta]
MGCAASDASIRSRDWAVRRMGCSADSDLQVPKDDIPVCSQRMRTFMHDNAPINRAERVQKWFENQAMPVLDGPLYSPDVNPVESLWLERERRVNEIDPDLKDTAGDREAISARLASARSGHGPGFALER